MIRKIIEMWCVFFNIIKRGDIVTFSESEYEIRTARCNGKEVFQLLDCTPRTIKTYEMENIRLFKKFFKPKDYAPIRGPWKYVDGHLVNIKEKQVLDCKL